MILVTHIYKNCYIEIKGHEFVINLIPIQLGEFDVILGMDWLSRHEAVIGCVLLCDSPDWESVKGSALWELVI